MSQFYLNQSIRFINFFRETLMPCMEVIVCSRTINESKDI